MLRILFISSFLLIVLLMDGQVEINQPQNSSLSGSLTEKDDDPTEEELLQKYKMIRQSGTTGESRNIRKETQLQLDQLLNQIKIKSPGSFASHYASYLNKNKSEESLADLDAAYLLHPEESELWDDMLFKSVIEGNTQQITAFATKLKNANVYSAAEMEYNRNVLNSLEQNTVLFTYGNADTYPLLILQNLYSYRTDVKIICLEWIGNRRFIRQASLWLNTDSNKLIAGNEVATLNNILSGATRVPVYLALTLPPSELSKYKDSLYCTGLAMKFCSEPLANLASLSYNWEHL
ncbi:MAG: hypothetical protein IT223_10325, partial [Crocinitomicaceae bacterium]|nr:hypothetical protein [Crocinitomicaceae bacterium]